ncbi:MAG TPA: aminotransferase class I/II-fold pyridoxal phosphate-dependent enzyme [Bacteroidales bacterium]|jgi:dTDP-4-amino-4,6-dideoxygalactose transaminase|nr:aminotransferase class I/II-fold pyridoxal phosphate-dependent enzyme [Bacteroidales bacterium]
MPTNQTIWLSSPHMSGNEKKYVDEAFARNFVFPMGPNVAGFEEDLKNFTGSAAVSCLSSGTAAIHLALINLGVEQGDEVICSSFTFSASANPIAYQKAIPVFIDSEPGTWNMSSELLETAINDRIAKGKKPKAIIVVHLYGMPAMMDEILAIANHFEIPVIEDAAEALGSTYKGRHCGTMGVIGILSFNGNKIITTSGGGAMISDNPEYCRNATFLATQARDAAPHYQHSHIGYNYRMSNICAGIGRGQMEVLPQRIEKRRENFQFYKEQLKGLPGITVHEEPGSEFFSNHWLTTILVDPALTGGITREDLRLHFNKHNIESRPLWKPMHLQPVFANYPAYVNGVSEHLFDIGLCLPSSSNITDEEREIVVQEIKLLFFNSTLSKV